MHLKNEHKSKNSIIGEGLKRLRNNLSQSIADQLVLPVITAPMFLVSSPDMVISASSAGIIGSFPSLNARTVEVLGEWMERISEELNELRINEPNRSIAPWALNIVLHQNENTRVKEEIALIKKYKPPIVMTALGNPAEVVKIVHSYGGKVFSDVTTLVHAKKAAKSGVDGLILVCCGAGGHAGTLNSFAFIREIKEFWDGITILAGGISSGQDILASQALGADLVYMGTRFIAASESFASGEYRKMLIESKIDDLVYTDVYSGIKANYLKSSIISAGLDPDNLGTRASFIQKDIKVWKDIWSAGHCIGRTKREQTVLEIIADLNREFEEAQKSLLTSIKQVIG
ncbi:NAD(P)H-dependent flavin oxidoreductase [Peribacillus frigoritolerans]|uniref:NAD(P)H-dependent flavin oxidoreductase n=1 Tax=Peribacillus frigoritolerans TaxID=450367 RepID=UPI00292ED61D|nr:nitronate monooxygenase [Peribacillus frigoritolerans]